MKLLNNTLGKVRGTYANRHEPEHLQILVNAYWRILISATVLIVAAVLCFGLWQLVVIVGSSRDASQITPSAATGPVLDNVQLEAAVKGFTERAAQYQFLKNNPPQVDDPSR